MFLPISYAIAQALERLWPYDVLVYLRARIDAQIERQQSASVVPATPLPPPATPASARSAPAVSPVASAAAPAASPTPQAAGGGSSYLGAPIRWGGAVWGWGKRALWGSTPSSLPQSPVTEGAPLPATALPAAVARTAMGGAAQVHEPAPSGGEGPDDDDDEVMLPDELPVTGRAARPLLTDELIIPTDDEQPPPEWVRARLRFDVPTLEVTLCRTEAGPPSSAAPSTGGPRSASAVATTAAGATPLVRISLSGMALSAEWLPRGGAWLVTGTVDDIAGTELLPQSQAPQFLWRHTDPVFIRGSGTGGTPSSLPPPLLAVTVALRPPDQPASLVHVGAHLVPTTFVFRRRLIDEVAALFFDEGVQSSLSAAQEAALETLRHAVAAAPPSGSSTARPRAGAAAAAQAERTREQITLDLDLQAPILVMPDHRDVVPAENMWVHINAGRLRLRSRPVPGAGRFVFDLDLCDSELGTISDFDGWWAVERPGAPLAELPESALTTELLKPILGPLTTQVTLTVLAPAAFQAATLKAAHPAGLIAGRTASADANADIATLAEFPSPESARVFLMLRVAHADAALDDRQIRRLLRMLQSPAQPAQAEPVVTPTTTAASVVRQPPHMSHTVDVEELVADSASVAPSDTTVGLSPRAVTFAADISIGSAAVHLFRSTIATIDDALVASAPGGRNHSADTPTPLALLTCSELGMQVRSRPTDTWTQFHVGWVSLDALGADGQSAFRFASSHAAHFPATHGGMTGLADWRCFDRCPDDPASGGSGTKGAPDGTLTECLVRASLHSFDPASPLFARLDTETCTLLSDDADLTTLVARRELNVELGRMALDLHRATLFAVVNFWSACLCQMTVPSSDGCECPSSPRGNQTARPGSDVGTTAAAPTFTSSPRAGASLLPTAVPPVRRTRTDMRFVLGGVAVLLTEDGPPTRAPLPPARPSLDPLTASLWAGPRKPLASVVVQRLQYLATSFPDALYQSGLLGSLDVTDLTTCAALASSGGNEGALANLPAGPPAPAASTCRAQPASGLPVHVLGVGAHGGRDGGSSISAPTGLSYCAAIEISYTPTSAALEPARLLVRAAPLTVVVRPSFVNAFLRYLGRTDAIWGAARSTVTRVIATTGSSAPGTAFAVSAADANPSDTTPVTGTSPLLLDVALQHPLVLVPLDDDADRVAVANLGACSISNVPSAPPPPNGDSASSTGTDSGNIGASGTACMARYSVDIRKVSMWLLRPSPEARCDLLALPHLLSDDTAAARALPTSPMAPVVLPFDLALSFASAPDVPVPAVAVGEPPLSSRSSRRAAQEASAADTTPTPPPESNHPHPSAGWWLIGGRLPLLEAMLSPHVVRACSALMGVLGRIGGDNTNKGAAMTDKSTSAPPSPHTDQPIGALAQTDSLGRSIASARGFDVSFELTEVRAHLFRGDGRALSGLESPRPSSPPRTPSPTASEDALVCVRVGAGSLELRARTDEGTRVSLQVGWVVAIDRFARAPGDGNGSAARAAAALEAGHVPPTVLLFSSRAEHFPRGAELDRLTWEGGGSHGGSTGLEDGRWPEQAIVNCLRSFLFCRKGSL